MADSETVERLVMKFTRQIASEFGQDCGPGEEQRVSVILRALAAEVERETRKAHAKTVDEYAETFSKEPSWFLVRNSIHGAANYLRWSKPKAREERSE